MWIHIIGIFSSGSFCFEYTDVLFECCAWCCGAGETCVANNSLRVDPRGGSKGRWSQFWVTFILRCTLQGNTFVLFTEAAAGIN